MQAPCTATSSTAPLALMINFQRHEEGYLLPHSIVWHISV